VSVTIQLRGDTAANWSSVNPVLASREFGINLDDLSYKIGDGVTAWNALPYRELTGIFAGALLMEAIANPSVPGAGEMRFYAHDIAGRIIPKWVGPSGLDNPVQSALWANGMILATPASGSALTVIGQAAPTVVGTLSHPAVTPGVNLRSSMRRAIITSAATANSASELRFAFALTYRGEVFGTIPTGGFFTPTRFAVSSTTALQRCAVGLFNTTAAIATTQSPSALTNCIFAGWDSADTQLQIMHNDGAGSCTKIPLGVNFPANNPAAVYEVLFFCAPSGDAVGYRVVRLDTGDVVTGVITTDLPAKSTTLTWHEYANNGGTAAAVVLELMRFYLETDY
jgi:Major tropism determinant N-terminal domain